MTAGKQANIEFIMENMMHCSYTLTRNEVVSAMQQHSRGSDLTIIIMVTIAVSLLLVGIFTEYNVMAFAAIGGVIGYFLVLLLVIPFNAKKQYKQHRALRNEITMLLSEQGINCKSDYGEEFFELMVNYPKKSLFSQVVKVRKLKAGS